MDTPLAVTRLPRGGSGEWQNASGLGIESGADAASELASAREEMRLIEGTFDAPSLGRRTLADSIHSIGMDNLLAAPRGMISSPWEHVNEFTNGGPRPGELWIIGARPSVGKTTVALQWALSAASGGKRVLFASLEMPQQDLLKRALSAEGDIPHGLLVRGDLDRTWRARVTQTLERIGEYPLEISDKLRSLSAVIAKIAAAGDTIGLLVVDYLGLLNPGWKVMKTRNQEVSYEYLGG